MCGLGPYFPRGFCGCQVLHMLSGHQGLVAFLQILFEMPRSFVFVCLYVCLQVCMSVCLSVCLSIFMYVCIELQMHVCMQEEEPEAD